MLGLMLLPWGLTGGEEQSNGFAACGREGVPLNLGPSVGLNVVSHHLSFGLYGEGWLALHNNTGKEITAAIILVTYYDASGREIFSIPYSGSSRHAPPANDQVRAYSTVEWHTRALPGADFVLVGTNLLSTSIDPCRAEATSINLRFADGTQQSILLGNRQTTEPLLVELPQFFEWDGVPPNLPDELELVLRINKRGAVSGVTTRQGRDVADSVLRQVTSNILRWTFYPATENGFAVDAELNLLVRFDRRGMPQPAPSCPIGLSAKYPRTFVEVDLEPTADRQARVLYSGHYAAGRFNTRVSYIEPVAGPGGP